MIVLNKTPSDNQRTEWLQRLAIKQKIWNLKLLLSTPRYWMLFQCYHKSLISFLFVKEKYWELKNKIINLYIEGMSLYRRYKCDESYSQEDAINTRNEIKKITLTELQDDLIFLSDTLLNTPDHANKKRRLSREHLEASAECIKSWMVTYNPSSSSGENDEHQGSNKRESHKRKRVKFVEK